MKLFRLCWHLKSSNPERTLTQLIRSGIAFTSPGREEEGLSFETNILNKKQTEKWCLENKYTFKISHEGIFVPIFELRRRPGIILGVILSLFFIWLSTFFIWSVTIEGNESIPDSEIIHMLEECGFKEGILKKSVDTNEIENDFLTRCHDITFLSINVHGMVAEVVVHERVNAPKAPNTKEPYNLVADFDGVVVSATVLDGMTLFNIGDTVFKGQLLVSGLVDSTSGVTNFRHSRGKVWARTNRTLTFEVPFELTEVEYTNASESSGIKVLGRYLWFDRDDDSGSYDVEIEEKNIYLFGLLLPIKRAVKHIEYYEIQSRTLSESEAEARAMEEYRLFISTELDSATVTKEEFSTRTTETSLILEAEVSAIENIAIEKKIEITE